MPSARSRLAVLAALALLLMACGAGTKKEAEEGEGHDHEAEESGLTPFQLENGIGPVTEVLTLGTVDPALASQGEQQFGAKCTACHKMKEKYVGPALGDVTVRRTPAYVMNMILNPAEMYTRHPVARDLLAQHMTQMPNLGLSRDEARAILEYLRTQAHTQPGN